jgi:hypothetical protein
MGGPPHRPARKRAPSNFRQSDVSRAVAAAQARGLVLSRVEIDPQTAKITLVIKDGDDTETTTTNPFDTAPLPEEPKARRTRKTK